MSKKQKLIDRFKTIPSDFSWTEFEKLMKSLGVEKIEGSSGRAKFHHGNFFISLHKPHPDNTVKKVYLRETKRKLEDENLI